MLLLDRGDRILNQEHMQVFRPYGFAGTCIVEGGIVGEEERNSSVLEVVTLYFYCSQHDAVILKI